MNDKTAEITPDMTVLDIIHRFRETEAVFKRYDPADGQCICCSHLFDSITDVSEKYDINLAELLTALKRVAS